MAQTAAACVPQTAAVLKEAPELQTMALTLEGHTLGDDGVKAVAELNEVPSLQTLEVISLQTVGRRSLHG